jgi:hypothetical protein
MESDIDPKNDLDSCLWKIFCDEYVSHVSHRDWSGWIDFINQKDLGVKCTITENKGYLNYEIVDHKKWLLSKLKYGI